MILITILLFLILLSLIGASTTYLGFGRYLNEKLSGTAKKVISILANIILFILLTGVMFVLFLCMKGGDWSRPDAYSDTVTDVIRAFTVLEVMISAILGMINRKKGTVAVLIICNIFTMYKFISTF